jgi:uncharacterized protein (DUF3084 family)
MEKSLTQIVEEIAQLRRAEQTVYARAAKLDYQIQCLRTKKYKILQEAKSIENERHELAREYHRIKSPCPTVLSEAEKQLGRKLTIEEVQKIEIYYAKKVGNSASLS